MVSTSPEKSQELCWVSLEMVLSVELLMQCHEAGLHLGDVRLNERLVGEYCGEIGLKDGN